MFHFWTLTLIKGIGIRERRSIQHGSEGRESREMIEKISFLVNKPDQYTPVRTT
jgi:hypothetical protein